MKKILVLVILTNLMLANTLLANTVLLATASNTVTATASNTASNPDAGMFIIICLIFYICYKILKLLIIAL